MVSPTYTSIALLLIANIALVHSLHFLMTDITTKQHLATRVVRISAETEKLDMVPKESAISHAVTDRRRLMAVLVPKILLTATIVGPILSSTALPKPAYGAYGDSSNIALPSYIDFLVEKNQQVDSSKFLYQGADRELQIQRIATAVSKIQTIPEIVRSKKWSQVQGVITGPLGTLIATMNQIAGGGTGTNKDAQKIIAKVKIDLFSIGQCATTKNESACLAATEATLNDVKEFVRVAF